MPAGVYLHIPFCSSRCSYCDFATEIYRDADSVESYTQALINEIKGSPHAGTEVETIYFGGGTPSLLSARQVSSILDMVREKFDLASDLEVTLEMNPGTVSFETLKEFKKSGINRASFGVQTFDDASLRLLARGHDTADVFNTYELLRSAGFENISFDLIAGLPGQTLDQWRQNLVRAVELDPEHLSLYILEIHKGTPLAEQVASGRQPIPDEDLAGKMYLLMQKTLAEAGYIQYEISNFAKPGFESKHNNKYWQMEPVFGFGVSAHSFDGVSRRWWNIRDTNEYVRRIEADRSPMEGEESLDEMQLSSEFAFLRLRLREGFSVSEFDQRFEADFYARFGTEVRSLIREGLIEDRGDRLRLTARGMLFSNEVFEVFV